jgi:gamma-glutamylcyclotransferase (GGCT)/AIG2-like uncharacterized protein YtfP
VSTFDLFVYGTLRTGGAANDALAGCERVGDGTVNGILYDIDGRFPALVLYGDAPVRGEVWRCPAAMLPGLDAYESTDDGLFRRVAVQVATGNGDLPCWTYAAGPALSRKLTPDRRLAEGCWPAPGA